MTPPRDPAAAPDAASAASAGPRAAAGRGTAAVVVAVVFMGSTLLTPLYDLYRSTYGFSAVVLVLLYAVYVVGNLAALLLLGRLSDQVGRRPVALIGLGLAAVSVGLFLAAQSPVLLFAGRIVSGCAVGVGAGAAAAWIADLTPEAERPRAAIVVTVANFLGLAAGPLLAGGLVQYAPSPLRLPFVANLVLLALLAVAVLRMPETVDGARWSGLSLRPRLGVPKQVRLRFVAPALTASATMALVGFYAALGPTMMRQALQVTNRALSGAAVAELFLVAAVAILLTRRARSGTAMLWGLGLMPAGLGLLIAAQRLASLPLLLAATALCGLAAALGYRGSLQVVNDLAPADQRAEVVSTYFLCGFLGNALPVIGVGVLSQRLGAPTADAVFAAVVSALAIVALVAGLFPDRLFLDPASRR